MGDIHVNTAETVSAGFPARKEKENCYNNHYCNFIDWNIMFCRIRG